MAWDLQQCWKIRRQWSKAFKVLKETFFFHLVIYNPSVLGKVLQRNKTSLCVCVERERERNQSKQSGTMESLGRGTSKKKNVTNRLPVIFDCIKGIYNTNRKFPCAQRQMHKKQEVEKNWGKQERNYNKGIPHVSSMNSNDFKYGKINLHKSILKQIYRKRPRSRAIVFFMLLLFFTLEMIYYFHLP